MCKLNLCNQSQTSSKNYVEQIVKKLRSSNAEISITAQVSTDRGSLDSMKNSISLVAESVDGVTSWYSGDQKALIKLESFVKWFSEKYNDLIAKTEPIS